MRTASAAFAAAMGTPEQTIATKVTVAWGPSVTGAPTDISGMFSSIAPQADLVTDMPDGSRQITGYTSRAATLVLSGTQAGDDPGLSAQELFDPYSPSSPLYGADWTGAQGGTLFTIYQGLADLPGQTTPEVYPIFSGYCTTINVNRTTGEITLTMIDTRIKISTVPNIPEAIAIYPSSVTFTVLPGLDSVWPLDYLLRSNGLYSSPPPVPGCIYYMSGHGSLWPEIGGSAMTPQFGSLFAGDFSFSGPPKFVPGAYGSQEAPASLVVADSFAGNGTIPFRTFAEGGISNFFTAYMQFGIKTSAVANASIATITLLGVDSGDQFLLTFGQTASGQLTVIAQMMRDGATSTSATITGVATAGWQIFGIDVAMLATNNITGSIFINGVTTALSTVGTVGAYRADIANVSIVSHNPMDTFQLSKDITSNGPPAAFTPTAFLDPSLNPLIAIPAYTNTDPWTLISDICEAEFATGSLDETQNFYFKNRKNRPTAPQLALTSKLNAKDLQFQTNESTRAQQVIAQVHPLGVVGPQIIYSQTGLITIPPNTTVNVIVNTPAPVQAVVEAFTYMPVGGMAGLTVNGVIFNRNPDGSGAAVLSGMGIIALQQSSSSILVSIFNGNAFTVYTAPTTGYDTSNGVVAILGLSVVDNSATGNGVQTSASYGSGLPSLTLTDNIWRQSLPDVNTMVQDELSDLVRPRPMITSLTVVGDSRLQLGDRVQIVDPGELSNSISPTSLPAKIFDDCIVTSIHPTVDTSGFIQALVLRAIASPRQWVLGQVGKSELGATTWI